MIKTGERRSLWHEYISIEFLNYNILYQGSIACEPSRVFYVLDLKLDIRPPETPIPTSQIEQIVLDQTVMTKLLCRLTSKTKLFMSKMSPLQNSKKQVMYITYSRNQTIK